ncbi:polyprenyl synthetase family protein [Streptomyces sp. NPDC102441]|uniref:polyprenyl synthetase family protein n=1 Tax=Streptomyces sp. NPDC102441 TaxID=3366176 RepID=UPI0037F36B2E
MLRSRAGEDGFICHRFQPDTGTTTAGADRSRIDDRAGPPSADARSVDEDVVAAVLRTAQAVLRDRVAQAESIDSVFSRDIAERVADFTLEGGKRMRPQFLWWGMRACGGGRSTDIDAALRLGVAVELIQTCALVHDDVMDASPLRRGRPAVHVDFASRPGPAPHSVLGDSFGTAAAVLVGDLALAWADDTVAETAMAPATRQRVRGVWRVMRSEMVAGQYLDLHGQASGSRSAARAIRTAYLKSALYSVVRPLTLGAALAGAGECTTRALASAGRCAGLAFQLRDDLLGVFGDPTVTGKPSGGDVQEGKPTYLMAVARSRAGAGEGGGAARAVLDAAVGRADLSDEALAEVRDVLVATGARAEVEDRADRLMQHAARHLAGAAVQPDARHRLLALLRSVGGTRSTPPRSATAVPPADAP